MIGMGFHIIAGILFFLKPSNYLVMAAIRFLQGFGAGFVSCCVMTMAVVWFPRKQRSLASGVMACFYGIANIGVTTYCTQMYLAGKEWNFVFSSFLIATNVVALLIMLFFYKDIEKKYGVINIDQAIEGSEYDESAAVKTYSNPRFKPYDSWGDALKKPSFWCYMVPTFLYCWFCYAIPFCLPLLLTQRGYSPEDSATIQSLTFLGAIIGSPIGGIISDRLFRGRRGETSAIAFIGGAIFLGAMPLAMDAGASIAVLSILLLMSYLVFHFAAGPAWVLPCEIATPRFSIYTMGLSLFATKIGGVLGPIVAGVISDNTGSIMGGLWVTVAVGLIGGVFYLILAGKWRL